MATHSLPTITSHIVIIITCARALLPAQRPNLLHAVDCSSRGQTFVGGGVLYPS